jgi:hypothetical protein
MQRIAVTEQGATAQWSVKLKPSIAVPRVSSGSSAAYP